MNVVFLPIDKSEYHQCCQCGIKASLVDIISGRFFCDKCTFFSDSEKYPFENDNYYES